MKDENQKVKYVKTPWLRFLPLLIFFILLVIFIFMDTGILVFNMPLETFVVCWMSFVYILVAALSYVVVRVRGGKENG